MIYWNYQYRATCQSNHGTGCAADMDALYFAALPSTQQDQFYMIVSGSFDDDLLYYSRFYLYRFDGEVGKRLVNKVVQVAQDFSSRCFVKSTMAHIENLYC